MTHLDPNKRALRTESSRLTVKELAELVILTGAAIVTASQLIGFASSIYQRLTLYSVGIIATFIRVRASRDTVSTILGTNDKPLATGAPVERRWKLLFGALIIILLFDSIFSFNRSPVESTMMSKRQGEHSGWTDSDGKEKLQKAGVERVFAVNSTPDNIEASYRSAVIADFKLKSRLEGREVLLHSVSLEVIDYEEAPRFKSTGASLGMMPSVKYSFMLSRRKSPLPWLVEPIAAIYSEDGDSLIDWAKSKVPYSLTDGFSRQIMTFINASEPGIYTFDVYLYVSESLGPIQRVKTRLCLKTKFQHHIAKIVG